MARKEQSLELSDMNPIVLALITSYLDARQRRKEWQAPAHLRETVRRYYVNLSPSTRGYLLVGL